MNLLILGASGRCGVWLTRLAAEQGQAVTAVVRDPSRFAAPPGVTVVRGEATDPATFDRVVPGHDAILSALGQRRAGLFPWSRRLSPDDLMQQVMTGLVPAMERHRVRRLVAISAAGVADSYSRCSWSVRRMVRAGNIGVGYRDLEAMEGRLADSSLDWLAVRPVILVDGEPTHRARPVDRFGLFSRVRRSDVAAWMLDAVGRAEPFAERRAMLGS
jgi:uncharacterized protein YbjT (DUF2867 family)